MTPEECRAWLKAKVDEYIDEEVVEDIEETELADKFTEWFHDHM